MVSVAEKLQQLRKLMEENGLWAYYVPTDDYHLSEYVSPYFKARQYISGFTGSAGMMVITPCEACLWVDSRYFIQSANQIKDTPIRLMKIGEPGVPSVEEYLVNTMPNGSKIGFDGRTVSARWAMRIGRMLSENNVEVRPEFDLVGMIWADRPALPWSRVWVLDTAYAGESAASKLSMIRKVMEKKGADIHVIAALDDIAWTLNIRGDDVKNCMLVLSYLVIEKGCAYLFVDETKLDEEIKAYFNGLNVKVLPYNDVYEKLGEYEDGTSVMVSVNDVNYRIYDILSRGCMIIDCPNPAHEAKIVKNPTELENMRKAHVKDGVTMTRFIKWVKDNVGKIPMDEYTVGAKIDEMHLETEGCLGISFGTTCAYGPNAAMPHYSASAENHAVIEPKGLLLVDCGGQYYEGTTDITRTFAVGELTDREKHDFTLVLRGMLNIADFRFPHGLRGAHIDAVCHAPLWAEGLDFKHSTGHGVGYLLNVHEGPNSFNWKRPDSAVLEEGMITSDEPGLYIEGSHGIRTENMVACRKGEMNEYGQFMYFEHLTCVPIDLEAVEPSLLSEREKALLNGYHEFVFRTISPYMDKDELEWLKNATRAI